MPDTQRASADELRATIEQALAQHSGSLERFRHWAKRIIYTPGVADMAEICCAYWLIDLVASHQVNPSVRAEEFQVWTLTVAADRTALAVGDDGNGHGVARQVIEFTDFPLNEIKLYLDQGTLMLPGEY
ncbi:DUF6876 family protein [Rhodopila globiformis]|uniref:DUF6876 domain-containing protein n=1 Tax=Rhodopila globiformis TaxID=1071 RepID=A0A2S6NHI7_RHOGL|nr:DUF6876 family protein [Rhodopila globiformis]PPQ34086.1 hypothetical protein CCS01_12550 [Rhodopila globiformis]